ncbi:hypothetical protein M8J75_016359 [Diaphorina citri]|nr:hypothetical protein M8J75_016359 [Diaphorina citri]
MSEKLDNPQKCHKCQNKPSDISNGQHAMPLALNMDLTLNIITLVVTAKLFNALETHQDVIDEKYNVKYQNLTADEKAFLDKVVNFDTLENLKYMILNKTQEMYVENHKQLYKQAEESVIFHENHLKIKYFHYFVRHQRFEVLYYPLVEKFFFKLLRYIPSEVKKFTRFVYYKELGHDKEEFLENEGIIDKRINIIRNAFDDAIKAHYVLADDLDVFNFVNNSRAKIDAFFQSPQYFDAIKQLNITLDDHPKMNESVMVKKDYRKYKYYFDIYHAFNRIYYTHIDNFFDKVFTHLRRELVAKFRTKSAHSFLANEALIDSRLIAIYESLDQVLTGHYCHVDDVSSRQFFKNFRYQFDERLYKNLRHEFDYHLGHEFFKSSES